MKWNVSSEEAAKNKLAQPGWHPIEIIDYEEAMNKNGDAMNAILTFRIFSGEFKGVEKKVWFSEKAPGMMAPLLEALGVKTNADGSLSADLNKQTLVGKKVQGNFIRGSYNNRPTNEINEYAPLS